MVRLQMMVAFVGDCSMGFVCWWLFGLFLVGFFSLMVVPWMMSWWWSWSTTEGVGASLGGVARASSRWDSLKLVKSWVPFVGGVFGRLGSEFLAYYLVSLVLFLCVSFC